MINRERLINTFFELIQIDSETGNEKPVADYIEPILKELGFDVVYDNANDKFPSNTGNLIASRGDVSAENGLILSSHMDTVKPGLGIKPRIDGDYIVADGTTILGGDDKSGIAAVLEALRTAKDENQQTIPLQIAFNIAEEGGLNGSRYMDYNLIKARRALILDSGGAPGNIVTKGPAQDQIEVKIKGKPAHAGVCPENGISAIQIASAAINNMKLLRIDEDTTANIGTINGGMATNIVCPEVVIKAEARSRDNDKLSAQTAHMVDCFERTCRDYSAEVEIDVKRAYNAFSVDDDHPLIEQVKSIFRSIGIDAKTMASGGGSDTNNFSEHGIVAVNLATGMDKVHTLEERIKTEHLEQITKFVHRFITN